MRSLENNEGVEMLDVKPEEACAESKDAEIITDAPPPYSESFKHPSVSMSAVETTV